MIQAAATLRLPLSLSSLTHIPLHSRPASLHAVALPVVSIQSYSIDGTPSIATERSSSQSRSICLLSNSISLTESGVCKGSLIVIQVDRSARESPACSKHRLCHVHCRKHNSTAISDELVPPTRAGAAPKFHDATSAWDVIFSCVSLSSSLLKATDLTIECSLQPWSAGWR
jgi:hypothetical protein